MADGLTNQPIQPTDPSTNQPTDQPLNLPPLQDLTKKSVNDWKDVVRPGQTPEDVAARELYIYYCQTLKFLASLCCGRNQKVRACVHVHVPAGASLSVLLVTSLI